MVNAGCRLKTQLVAFRLNIPMKEDFRLHNGFELGVVLQQDVPFVSRMMSWQIRPALGGIRLDTPSIVHEKIGPANDARIRIADNRPYSSPGFAVRLDQRVGPAWSGKRVALSEHYQRRGGSANSSRGCRGQRKDSRNLDNFNATKTGSLSTVESKAFCRLRNDQQFK